MSETLTKKNHYVPQSYLRMFESDEAGKSLGVYNKEIQRLLNFSTASGQGFERFLYWNNISGSNKNHYENQLGLAETECGEIFKRISAGQGNTLISLSHNEIFSLTLLLAFQIFRTPEILSDITTASQDMKLRALELLEESRESSQFTTEQYDAIRELIETNDDKDTALSTMLLEAKRFIETILKDFSYSISLTNEPLITCDRPVIQLEDGGLIHSSTYYPSATEFIMPLSRGLVFTLIRKNSNSKKLLDLSAAKVNEYIVRNASSRIYFHPDDTKYAVNLITKVFTKFKDEPIYKPNDISGFGGGLIIKAFDITSGSKGSEDETLFKYESFSFPTFWSKTDTRVLNKADVIKIYNKCQSFEKTADSIMLTHGLEEEYRQPTLQRVKEVVLESLQENRNI